MVDKKRNSIETIEHVGSDWKSYKSLYGFQITDKTLIKLTCADGLKIELMALAGLDHEVRGSELVVTPAIDKKGQKIFKAEIFSINETYLIFPNVIKDGLIVISQKNLPEMDLVGFYGNLEGGIQLGKKMYLGRTDPSCTTAAVLKIEAINVLPDNVTDEVSNILRKNIHKQIGEVIQQQHEEVVEKYKHHPHLHSSVTERTSIDKLDPGVKMNYMMGAWEKEAQETGTLSIGEEEFLRITGLFEKFRKHVVIDNGGIMSLRTFRVVFKENGKENEYEVYAPFLDYNDKIAGMKVTKIEKNANKKNKQNPLWKWLKGIFS